MAGTKRRRTDTGNAQIKRKDAAPRATTRAKGTSRQRKVGGLERLLDMPLDIVFEIMRYLMPIDILRLARTSKLLRQFLMARSAAPLWRAARQNVPNDFPDCPEHLSEPAYANLVFDYHCHECQKSGVKHIYWTFGVKYCPRCRSTMLVKCKGQGKCMFGGASDEGCIPWIYDGSSPAHWHHIPDVKKFNSTITKLKADERKILMEETRSLGNFALLGERWELQEAWSRNDREDAARTRRLEAIVLKLRDIGWGPQLDMMKPEYELLAGHPDVIKPKDLTERTWSNMRDRLMTFMADKIADIHNEYQGLLTVRFEDFASVYTGWYSHQPEQERVALPRAIELMRRPEVLSLVKQDCNVNVDTEDFLPLRADFLAWAAEWRAGKAEVLRRVVRDSSQFKNAIPEDVDPLTLRTLAFDCATCRAEGRMDPLLFPALLGHDCLYAPVSIAELDDMTDLLDAAVISATFDEAEGDGHLGWSAVMLRVRKLLEDEAADG